MNESFLARRKIVVNIAKYGWSAKNREKAKTLKREEVSRVLPKKGVANLVDTVNGRPLKRKVAEKKSL